MPQFIKKPIEVSAIQYKHDRSQHSYMDEQNGLIIFAGALSNDLHFDKQQVFVNTNHGAVTLNNGDYLIKSNDELYPCSKEIFEQNYIKAPSTWLDRVKQEKANMQTMLDALEVTLRTESKPEVIAQDQWDLMHRQQFHMRQYVQILEERINKAKVQS